MRSLVVVFFCCVAVTAARNIEELFSDFGILGGAQLNNDCGPNEVFDCVYPCPPLKTCADREEYACLGVEMSCAFQCVCKPGFYLNKPGGECVTEKQCNKCPGEHEHYACGGPCDDVCSTLHVQNKTTCAFTECQPSCYCDDGYARNDSGICIPIEECAATVAQDTEYLFSGIGLPISQEEGNDCGPNEVYDCVYPCPPLKTCADREEYACLEEIMSCEFQCVCKPGFYLNKPGGVCVTEKQCNKCPGEHEHYACGGPCDDVCSTLHVQNKTTCAFTECQPSCYCDDGYARNDSGICIPIEECRTVFSKLDGGPHLASTLTVVQDFEELPHNMDIKIPQENNGCGQNEVFDCVYSCSSQKTCGDREETYCPDVVMGCDFQCVCKPGYYLNKPGGVCVTEEQCNKCPGEHEHYACGGPCDDVCSTLHVQNKTTCAFTECQPSCYCDDGYARNDSGICIPIEECDESSCGQNEEYTDCINPCLNETCSAIGSQEKCDSKVPCKPGCVCKEGYFRKNQDSSCEPACSCPEKKDSPDCLSWQTWFI
nr:zonadhesin isoform X3 [Helicoverpa armigera]